MKKRDYKAHTKPRTLEKKEEILSHSSLLTNKRLDILFMKLDATRITAWTNVCVPTITDYYAVLSGIYNTVFTVFNEQENQEIIKRFKKYNEYNDQIHASKKRTLLHDMLKVLDEIHQYINGYLQKRQYFFKMGTPEIKGIKKALDLFKEESDEDESGDLR